eukprot:8919-Heterococcus_DN1.PRE.5
MALTYVGLCGTCIQYTASTCVLHCCIAIAQHGALVILCSLSQPNQYEPYQMGSHCTASYVNAHDCNH